MKHGKKRKSLLGQMPSIRQAFFLVLMILVQAGIVIVVCISLRYTNSMIYENSVAYTKQIVSQVNDDIDSYIQYMENISTMVSSDPDLQSYMFGRDQEAGERLEEQFAIALQSHTDVRNIGIIAPDGRYLINDTQTKRNLYTVLSEQPWYQELLEAPGGTALSSSHVQNLVEGKYPWVITLSRIIHSPEKPAEQGLFFIDLNYESISRLCDNNSVGRQGEVFILDRKGNIVYHPRQQMLYGGLLTEYTEEIMACKTDSIRIGKGRHEKLYTISRSSKTGWTVVGSIYTAELLRGDAQTKLLYLLTAFALCVAALLIANALARSITGPIQRLRNSMARIQEGKFDRTHLEVETRNEIGVLTGAFNAMTDRIRELMEQIIYEQKEKRKSEMKALQSQINPHFLYNTLDSIIWMAEGGKTDEVVLMTASLARLLRQTIGTEEEETTIAREFEYVKSYLTIQKMRYKDKLDFFMELDPSIGQEMIVKLILQPIVENAIYHGLKYKETKGTLSVVGYGTLDNIIIEIRDDGVGMDQETLEHIFEKHKVNYQSNGVGVYNVQKRLQLYYGPGYGLSYTSTPGEGTVVTVKIPRMHRRQKQLSETIGGSDEKI